MSSMYMNKQPTTNLKARKMGLKGNPTSYRPDDDLVEPIQEWLDLNKGMKLSTLLNLAVRDFITKSHTLDPVEVVEPTDKQFSEAFDNVIKRHNVTLSELAEYDKSSTNTKSRDA